ncbi:MAG TPA: ATP-binding protein, partial [Acidobacteriota bacterium]|nr:ATP-binding protein [Acidobacteriota bacterium]
GLLAVKLQTEPDGQVITVTDRGVGIPSDKLDQIFEPYYSTKETGIGLGLAVTRKLIEEHNGSILVRSTVGVGTTFVIRLPLSILEHSASSTGA